jgi:hypothetical protein
VHPHHASHLHGHDGFLAETSTDYLFGNPLYPALTPGQNEFTSNNTTQLERGADAAYLGEQINNREREYIRSVIDAAFQDYFDHRDEHGYSSARGNSHGYARMAGGKHKLRKNHRLHRPVYRSPQRHREE